MIDGKDVSFTESFLEGLNDMLHAAERRGYDHGYSDARKFDGVIDPKLEVFILPAHSTIGNWQAESCAWSPVIGPDFYVKATEENMYWQTEEECRAEVLARGYKISLKLPHDPGMRRQHIRPPYSW